MCVCIDLQNGECLDKVQKLPYDIAVPDVIETECDSPTFSAILRAGFSALHLDEKYMRDIYELNKDYPGLSIVDAFCLKAAQLNGAILVTGDSLLRKTAGESGLLVHGTLWLLDEMVRYNVISKTCAANCLADMLETGSRLPDKECRKRFELWK